MKHIILALSVVLFAFTAQAAVSARVGLEWQRSSDDAGDIIYRVYRGNSGSIYTEQFDAAKGTNYWFDDITPGIPYFFTVTALRDGLESLPADEVTYTAPTGQPVTQVVNATFRRDATTVLAEWTANPANQLVFQYEVAFKPTNAVDYASVMVTTTSASIPVDGTSVYNFRVRAMGPAGVGPWLERIVPVLPGPPLFLLVKANGGVQYVYKP